MKPAPVKEGYICYDCEKEKRKIYDTRLMIVGRCPICREQRGLYPAQETHHGAIEGTATAIA